MIFIPSLANHTVSFRSLWFPPLLGFLGLERSLGEAMERRSKEEEELNLCEVKIVNLAKAWEKFQSEASGLLVLSLQWRDLEDHLKSVKGNVEKRFVELENRSVEIDEREKVVEAWEVKADGFRREVEGKEEELSGLRMLVEECRVEKRLKDSELDEVVERLRKTQGEIGLKVEELVQVKIDLERHRVEMSLEMDRAETRRRELDKEIERKTRDLTLVQDKVAESDKLLETRSLELAKTQGELDLKVEQLGQVKIDFARHQNEFTAEMDRAETRRRELDKEIERKTRDLTLVQDKVVESDKLLETRSLELTKTLCELDLKVEQLGQVKIDFAAEMEHLKRIQTRNRELEEGIERKRRDLAEVLDKTTECKKVLETRSLELVSKEKELQELSLDLDLKEEVAKSLDNEMEETCQKTESKAKELEAIERMINERSGHCESIKLLIEEHTEELALKEKRHDEIREATLKLSVEIACKENTLTKRNKQVEEGEKKIQDLNNTSEELIRQVFSINAAIRECTCELEAKRKQRDEVQSSITDLTAVLKSAEKKIQESLEDLKSTEEKQVKLKASLSEHEKGLELRAKELIAREEKINEQDQKLQLAKQELAKWVEDYEVKTKQLVALTSLDKPIGNSRKRGRHDTESLSQSFEHVLTSCTTGQENTYNFEKERSPDKFKIDQIWAVYSDSDKGMPRKYAQIKKIDTSPEFKLHVATLVLYRPPPPNLMTHPVCCGRFKLKIGKAEVLEPSSFSHEVKALKTSVNRFEVYPRKGEVWALYKSWNITDCADGSEEEELQIVEIVETDEQSIQAMLLTAKLFNQVLYGRCLESKARVLDIPKTEVNRFSHQIPAFRRDRRAAQSGDCEWWELDSKAVLDLNSKNP
ncbi:unnamed protein product [Brassica rapa]|uniref:DUF3444 domain-containing protein n=1 Tax=Brassica campestris TaxID=3711 RepID=A0A8D9HD82_BRACM|nr:unnamed protein product [Brassica rapa]